MAYPREFNSEKIVHENDWNQEAPFGQCPACGSMGIEELHIAGDEDICFVCSDEKCLTIMGNRRPARTKWNCPKPQEILDKEETGWSWNAVHFPGRRFPVAFAD